MAIPEEPRKPLEFVTADRTVGKSNHDEGTTRRFGIDSAARIVFLIFRDHLIFTTRY
jgi:hypothetical protein